METREGVGKAAAGTCDNRDENDFCVLVATFRILFIVFDANDDAALFLLVFRTATSFLRFRPFCLRVLQKRKF